MGPRVAMDSAENSSIQAAADLDLRTPCYCEENAWRVVYRHLHLAILPAIATDNGKDRHHKFLDCGTCTDACEYEYHVVFISNESRCCPFYRQRAVPIYKVHAPVHWDYHVIVIRTIRTTSPSSHGTEVLDVDTWLPYPCPIQTYLDETFRPRTTLTSSSTTTSTEFQPLFRVIPAQQYLQYFYSDRMHMFQNGKWMARPPDYPPIMNGLKYAEENTNTSSTNISNLEKYIDMMQQSSSSLSDGVCGSTKENETTIDEQIMGTVLTFDEFHARFTL